MLTRTVMRCHRMVIVAVLTLALVASAWGHRMPEVSDQARAFMAATGATTADFCGGTGQSDRHADPLCQACQIAGGVDLPPPAGALLDVELVLLTAMPAPRESRFEPRTQDTFRVPQGPPVA
jgi:hypothetical protein